MRAGMSLHDLGALERPYRSVLSLANGRDFMKSGKCPKCGSADVLQVPKRYPEPRGVVAVTLWSSVPVDDFICGACGFVETYLHNMKDLDQIKKRAYTGSAGRQ